MMNQLPKIEFENAIWIVDLRLKQIRRDNSLEFLNFKDIKDEKLKATIRGIRARAIGHIYIEGLDD